MNKWTKLEARECENKLQGQINVNPPEQHMNNEFEVMLYLPHMPHLVGYISSSPTMYMYR